MASWPPKIAATRSNWARPTRPQLMPPTMTSTSVTMLSIFMECLRGNGCWANRCEARRGTRRASRRRTGHGGSGAPARARSEASVARHEDLVDHVDHAIGGGDVGLDDVGVVDHHPAIGGDDVDAVAVDGRRLVQR